MISQSQTRKTDEFRLGCEVLLQSPPPWFRSGRLGLLANQASVNRSLGKHQETDPGSRRTPDLPLFATARILFGKTGKHDRIGRFARPRNRRPGGEPLLGNPRTFPEALEKIDVLLIDLQDVGTRVYTYTTTIGLCLEAAARAGTKVAVLDRPNPINGTEIEGNVLDPAFRSFVGRYRVPMRHGLTTGRIRPLRLR